jgi:condensin-2 complex subunit D3
MLLETFQLLLDSSPQGIRDDVNNFYNDSMTDGSYKVHLDDRQGFLCYKLHRQLQKEVQQHRMLLESCHGNRVDLEGSHNFDHNKIEVHNGMESTKSSVRMLFPDMRVADLLPRVITPLLNARVETQQLLPATQDLDANEEVLDNKAALSLTVPAMTAGRLYAHLLSRPGALGSGLVDLEPLTALVALIRRWNLECCGRERDALPVVDDFQPQEQNVQACSDGGSPSKSPPKKRSRRNTVDSEDDFSDNDGEQDDSFNVMGKNVLGWGGLVAFEVAKIAQQPEFASWSFESREILLEGVVAIMGTAAALIAGKGDNINGITTAQSIIEEGKKALVQCLAGETKIGKKDQFQQHRHESVIVILRCLLHLLQQKVVLPNGERGLQNAHIMAGQIVTVLMLKLHENANSESAIMKGTMTPKRRLRQRPSLGSLVNTPQSMHTKRRLSIDGITPMTSPALKKKRAPLYVGVSQVADRNPLGVPALFVGLLQKLATGRTGLEKAALRKSTVKIISSCLDLMAHVERAHFLRYVLKIGHSKVSVHRLVACELLGKVLSQSWLAQHKCDFTIRSTDDDYERNDASHSSPDEGTNLLTLPQALRKCLQGRLVDRISSVRAAAAALIECVVSSALERQNTNETFLRDEDVEPLLLALGRRASKDNSATVRKTSILALAKLLTLHKDNLSNGHLAVICDLCQDSSLLTRRAAAESLTMMLQVFTDCSNDPRSVGLIEDAWSSCVLPMVLDEETSTKAVNAFRQIVVVPISDYSESLISREGTAWRILSRIGNLNRKQGTSKSASLALEKALNQLGKEQPNLINGKLSTEAVRIAKATLYDADLSEDKVVGAWCLVEALLSIDSVKPRSRSKKFEFCARGWENILRRHMCTPQVGWLKSTLKSSLSALIKSSSTLEIGEAEKCQTNLLQNVLNFALPPDVLGAAIAALWELTSSIDLDRTDNNNKTWVRTVFARCEDEMLKFLHLPGGDSERAVSGFIASHEQTLVRALFTAGEVSVVDFNPEDEEKNGSSLHVSPSKRLKELIQIFVSDSLPGDVETQMPPSIRAHAFTVLGKFCLRDEILARRSLTILARELHPSITNINHSVQSNALLVLGDLCVRYTNMADRYLPVMASCLQNGSGNGGPLLVDRSAVVRKHAVLLLSNLLLLEFIKWRGLLFHRFLVACSDHDEEVAVLAETVLAGPLWVRNPKLFFNHFVESIFVLNRCAAHPIYISAASHGDGGSGIAVGFEGINLEGAGGECRRRQMYDFLLSKLSDEEKIGVTARLVKEVLGGAIEMTGDLSKACQGPPNSHGSNSPRLQSAWNVLTDTFYVLTSKAIKVRKAQDDADSSFLEDPNLPNPNRQVVVAKSRLLSKISLKHMMEIVMPILCNLKVKLQASNSPLLKELMIYLLEIFKSYRGEVKEFLADDPVLLQEIEFDARQQQAGKV